MDIQQIEKELRKRLVYPYIWGRKQTDAWDSLTQFIYKSYTFDDIVEQTHSFSDELKNYALNRWYNFWSAQAVEHFFALHPKVKKYDDPHHKFVDFTIQNIPFDHKTTVYPKQFGKSLVYAIQHKEELIKWLYNNQSQEGRKHDKNRIFIVLVEVKSNAHWQLKADLKRLQMEIENYLQHFSINNLTQLDFGEGKVYADIIWVINE